MPLDTSGISTSESFGTVSGGRVVVEVDVDTIEGEVAGVLCAAADCRFGNPDWGDETVVFESSDWMMFEVEEGVGAETCEGVVRAAVEVGVVSIVIDDDEVAMLGPVLKAWSRTEFADKSAMTVPSDVQVTTIVTELEVDVADGEKIQPVAVPKFEKSPPAIRETGSLNVRV